MLAHPACRPIAAQSRVPPVPGGVTIVLVVLLLPYLLAPLYRFVDPVSTLMLGRWVTGKRVERTWVPLAAMSLRCRARCWSPRMRASAPIAGLTSASCAPPSRTPTDLSEMRGGSTIAQQTAKNLFLWPGRSVVRKALEFPLALWLDLVVGKRRVMEIYLNIAEWGPGGEFGAEAGARHAFGKSARDVNAREAALLAADPAQSGAPQRQASRCRREPAGRDLPGKSRPDPDLRPTASGAESHFSGSYRGLALAEPDPTSISPALPNDFA
jgi:monofunctional biosynthetic peptidoglycan transglycosylase